MPEANQNQQLNFNMNVETNEVYDKFFFSSKSATLHTLFFQPAQPITYTRDNAEIPFFEIQLRQAQ